MRQLYYIISSEDAHKLGVTAFRKGDNVRGYVVTVGDLVTAPEEIRDSALPVSEKEAERFIKEL